MPYGLVWAYIQFLSYGAYIRLPMSRQVLSGDRAPSFARRAESQLCVQYSIGSSDEHTPQ